MAVPIRPTVTAPPHRRLDELVQGRLARLAEILPLRAASLWLGGEASPAHVPPPAAGALPRRPIRLRHPGGSIQRGPPPWAASSPPSPTAPSELVLPLAADGRHLGWLWLTLAEGEGLAPHNRRLLEVVAEDLALLIDGESRQRQETAENARLRTLMEVAHILTSTLDLDTVIDAILAQTIRAIPAADAGALFLHDPAADELVPCAAVGFQLEPLRGVRLRPGESMTGKTFARGQATLFSSPAVIEREVRTMRPANRALYDQSIRGLPRPHSVMCAPLIARDTRIGVITVDNFRARYRFSEEDLAFLQSIANQAAIAVENARLYRDQREQLAALERLNEVIRAQHAEMARAVAIHDRLTEIVLQGGGLASIADTLAAIIGNPVVVEDQFFQLLAASSDGGPYDALRRDTLRAQGTPRAVLRDPAVRQAIQAVRASRRPGRLPRVPDLGLELPRMLAPIMAGDDCLGYVSVLESRSPLADLDIVALEHAATVFALELTRQRSVFEAEQRLRGDLLDAILAGEVDERLLERARFLGCDPTAQYLVLLLTADRAPAPDRPPTSASDDLFLKRRVYQIVETAIGDRAVPTVLVARREGVVAMLGFPHPTDPAAAASAARALADDLRRAVREGLDGLTISIGIGRLAPDLASLRRSYTEARQALELTAGLASHDRTVAFDDLGAARLLLQVPQKGELQAFVTEQLGPLLAHDRAHQTQLVATLAAYAEADRDPGRACAALFIHRNTLFYRLHRIEDLLGRSLADSEVWLNLLLALKLHRLLGG